eukprot:TRINITY_DN3041_c0_g1_i6.p1 TRINITY_DN3041_c0_g1~~TRINITY_DN3041_c0_g1_i6.p1  ORF type:complete len:529 (-),score=98.46 TRINITY_DN3041_c0_g1_i6:37-1623(-)
MSLLPIKEPEFKAQSTGKQVAEGKKSPVLLVVMYVKNYNVEPDSIYLAFSPFGSVQRILMFERGAVTKAFVEFETAEMAENAKAQLEGKMLFEDGTKSSIFYANFNRISFKLNSDLGRDYTKEPYVHKSPRTQESSHLGRLKKELEAKLLTNPRRTTIREEEPLEEEEKEVNRELENRDDELIDSILESVLQETQMQVPTSTSSGNLVSTNYSLGTVASQYDTAAFLKQGHAGGNFGKMIKEPPGLTPKYAEAKPTSKKRFSANKTKPLDPVISAGFSDYESFVSVQDLIKPNPGATINPDEYDGYLNLENSPNLFAGSGMREITSSARLDFSSIKEAPPAQENLDKMKGSANIEKFSHILSDHKSSVLYMKGLEPDLLNVTMLYNLFSNFGNISKIMFVRSKGIALAEYETVQYATIAKDYLNNLNFMGSLLRIYFSKYDTLIVKTTQPEGSDEEVFIGSAATNRFKAYRPISINPPSMTLHVSNILHSFCKEDIFLDLFNKYGKVDALKFLSVSYTHLTLPTIYSV